MAYSWYWTASALGNATLANSGFSSLTGTAANFTLDTSVKYRSGDYGSWKFSAGAVAATLLVARTLVFTGTTGRVSARIRNDTARGAASPGTRVISCLSTAASTQFSLNIDSSGVLRIAGGSGGSLNKSTGITLTLAQWYRVSMAWTLTNTTTFTIQVYVDGVLATTATGADGTISGVAPTRLEVGWTSGTPANNAVLYINEIVCETGVSSGDLGNFIVTRKKPVGLGTTNAFDTLVGSGTNRYNRVQERPADTANGMTQAATAAATEAFTVESLSAGDVDISSGYTNLDWGAYALYAVVAGAGSTIASVVVNGSSVGFTTTAASGVYQTGWASANSTTLASSGNVAGLAVASTAVDCLLRECGVLVLAKVVTTSTRTAGQTAHISLAGLTRTAAETARISVPGRTRTAAQTADISVAGGTVTLTRTVGQTSHISRAGITRTVAQTVVLQVPRRIAETAHISVPGITRTVAQAARLSVAGITRTVAETAHVLYRLTRTIAQTASLSETRTRTAAQTASLAESKTRSAGQSAHIGVAGRTRTAAQVAHILRVVTRTIAQTADIIMVVRRTAAQTAHIRSTETRTAQQRAGISTTLNRTTAQTADILYRFQRVATQRAVIIGGGISREAPQSAHIAVQHARSAPSDAAISTAGLTITAGQSAYIESDAPLDTGRSQGWVT